MQDEHAKGMTTTSLRAGAAAFVPTPPSLSVVGGDSSVAVAVGPPTAPPNTTRRKRQRQRRPNNPDQHSQHAPSSSKDGRNSVLETNTGSDERSSVMLSPPIVVTNDEIIPSRVGDTILLKPKNRGRRKQQQNQKQQHQKQHHKQEQPEPQVIERQFSNEKNQRHQKNDRSPHGRDHQREGPKRSGGQQQQQQQQQEQRRRRQRATTTSLGNGENENAAQSYQFQEQQHNGISDSSPSTDFLSDSSPSTDFLSVSSFPSLLDLSKNKGDKGQEWVEHPALSVSRTTTNSTSDTTPTIDWITPLRRQQQEHEKLELQQQQQQQQRQHDHELSLIKVKLEPLGGRGKERTLKHSTQSLDMITNNSHTTLRWDDSVTTYTTTMTTATSSSSTPPPDSNTTTTTTTCTTSASSTDTRTASLWDDDLAGTSSSNPVHVEIEALVVVEVAAQQPNASNVIRRSRRVHNMDRLRNNWWLAWRIRNQRKEVLIELVGRHQCLPASSSPPPSPSPAADPSAANDTNENLKNDNSGDHDHDHGDILENQRILNHESVSSSTHQVNSFVDAEKNANTNGIEKSGQTNDRTNETLMMGSAEDGSVLWERAQNPWESSSRRALALKTLVAQWIAFCSGDAAAPAAPRDGPVSLTLVEQAVRLTIELDQPMVLEKLLRLSSQAKPEDLDMTTRGAGSVPLPPLLFAAQLGRDECLSVLLTRPTISSLSSSVSSKKSKKQNTQPFLCDDKGNNVFHMCCQGPLATEFTLQLLLGQLSSSALAGGKSKKQQHGFFSKVLLGTNRQAQTPLHVACERGRVDFVEKLLEFVGDHDSSLLPKILVLRDDSHQTPLLAAVAAHATNVVLSLLLWRVNDSSQHEKQQLLHLEQQRQQERQQHQQQELRLLKKINAGSSTSTNIPTGRYPGKGNHDLPNDRSDQQSAAQAHTTFSCPLVWAAKGWNLEMLQLLLEFANDHTTPYQHTQALYACLVATPSSNSSANNVVKGTTGDEKNATLSSQLDCVQLLIQAGANPFQETSDALTISSFSAFNGLITGHGTTAVSGPFQNDVNNSLTAVSLVSAVVGSGHFSASHAVLLVQHVIETGRRQLQERQVSRRQDPMLRQQPETFFSALESKENAELQNALSQALVQSLLAAAAAAASVASTGATSRTTHRHGLGMMDDGETSWTRHSTNANSSRQQDHLLAAAALYRGGAQLRDVDFELLRCKLAMAVEESCVTARHGSQSTRGGKKESARASPYCQHQQSSKEIRTFNYKTSILCRMPWMRDVVNRDLGHGCCCERMAAELERRHQSNEEVEQLHGCDHDNNSDLVTLVARDGTRFLVHGTVVAQSSQKLDAAVRFATMATNPLPPSRSTPDEEALRPEIQVDLDPQFCKYLLQHIYHGSIVFERNVRTFANVDVEAESETNRIAREVLELLLIAEEFLCPSLAQECEIRLLVDAPTDCFCWSCVNSKRPQSPHSISSLQSGRKGSNGDFLTGGGPSCILTPTTVLDVLAVIQQLESSSIMKMMETSILRVYHSGTLSSSAYNTTTTMIPSTSTTKATQGTSETNTNTKSSETGTKALSALKDAAICVILKEFRFVVRGEAFQENCSYNELSPVESSPSEAIETSEQALLLLQMCLEEFGASPFKKHPILRAKENGTKSL